MRKVRQRFQSAFISLNNFQIVLEVRITQLMIKLNLFADE